MRAVICISVAILDGWKSEDLGRRGKKTYDFSGQKSNPVHQKTGFLIGRVGVKRTITFHLMVRVTRKQEISPQKIMGDVKRTISRALSFLDSKGKTVFLKPGQGTAVISLLRGEDILDTLVCTVSERADQTSFSFGHLPAQEHYIGLSLCSAAEL